MLSQGASVEKRAIAKSARKKEERSKLSTKNTGATYRGATYYLLASLVGSYAPTPLGLARLQIDGELRYVTCKLSTFLLAPH